MYNLLGSSMDRFVPSGCNILQYTDDIVVYSSHHVLQTACALGQRNCSSLSVFFAIRTHDILYNVGVAASGLDQGWWQIVATGFKYLGVFFYAGLRWGT
jgi:hypothetical protein